MEGVNSCRNIVKANKVSVTEYLNLSISNSTSASRNLPRNNVFITLPASSVNAISIFPATINDILEDTK